MSDSLNNMLLSICVPAFNQKQALAQTLQTLECSLSQNTTLIQEIEILVSNNASTDGTPLEREFWQQRGITWFDQTENLGFRGNLQFLSSKASGDFVWFIGCGEIVDERSLVNLCKWLPEESLDLITVGTGAPIVDRNAFHKFKKATKQFLPAPLYAEAVAGNIYSSSILKNLSSAPSITGNAWPHIEIALNSVKEIPGLRAGRFDQPLVALGRDEDGWWLKDGSYELLLTHVQLLCSEFGAVKSPWLLMKRIEISTTGIWQAFKLESGRIGKPIHVDGKHLTSKIAGSFLAKQTLLLLRVFKYVKILE